MSIIYDALKKVEKSSQINSKENKPKPKIFLLYLLVICLGVLITNVFFSFITKPPQTNGKTLAKKQPEVNIKQDINIQKDTNPYQEPSFLETKRSVPTGNTKPAETQRQSKTSLILNGIFFSQNKGYALINNQIVKESDIIDGATVMRIGLDEVELKSKEGLIIKLSSVNKF